MDGLILKTLINLGGNLYIYSDYFLSCGSRK